MKIARIGMVLENYLQGFKDANFNKVTVMGEDFEHNLMKISIADLPSWIKEGVKFKLEMSEEDIKIIKDYFEKMS